jgi:hypothetical protein
MAGRRPIEPLRSNNAANERGRARKIRGHTYSIRGEMTARGGRGRLEPIPRAIRAEVVEAAGGFTLNEIRRLFEAEGFSLPPDFEPTQGSMRMSMANAFDESIDLRSSDDVAAYLRVVERLIDDLNETAARTVHRWAPDRLRRLQRELARAGVVTHPDGRLTLAAPGLTSSTALTAAPTESGIRLAMTTLERSDGEPEEKVGAAKELVEATVKHALAALDEPTWPTPTSLSSRAYCTNGSDARRERSRQPRRGRRRWSRSLGA